MIRKIIFLCTTCLVLSVSFAQKNDLLDSILLQRNFFLLKDTLASHSFSLSEKDSLYYYSHLNNFLNRSVLSNQCIDRLLKNYIGGLDNKKQVSLIKLSIDNYVKTYEYAAASRESQRLLDNYAGEMLPDEMADIKNSTVIWKSLRKVARQRVQIKKDTRIPYRRDLAGLLTIPVDTDKDSSQYFVFDTGANISVITETNAKKNKLLLLQEPFEVTAITGIKILARCAIAKTLQIGDIVLKNVVFMVFPDSALAFGDKYRIEGIIGFPVIEQLDEVRINKNGYMKIPAVATPETYSNLGLDELTPVIRLRYGNTSLPFTFDTGGQETFLNAVFYNRYKTAIEAQGRQEYLRYGGAGGLDSVRSYELAGINFQIAGKQVMLKNISVKTEAVSPKENIYYGNLGQDAITQFEEVIINFKYMYLAFGNGENK